MNVKHWSIVRYECEVSDSDIETFRQRHQEISTLVGETDNFLKFHNAGAFCSQLINSILVLYDLIFFDATDDLVVIMMRVFWTFGDLCGLFVTTAGGIMVNHYVSIGLHMFLIHHQILNSLSVSSLVLRAVGLCKDWKNVFNNTSQFPRAYGT